MFDNAGIFRVFSLSLFKSGCILFSTCLYGKFMLCTSDTYIKDYYLYTKKVCFLLSYYDSMMATMMMLFLLLTFKEFLCQQSVCSYDHVVLFISNLS